MPPPAFKPSAVQIHPAVDAEYARLERAAREGLKPQQGIWKRFEAALARLRLDAQWGEVIRRNMIPAYFQEKYQVANLYCIDLKGDVRCFYTIDARAVVVLDLVDHHEYDKWFPPKGRRPRRP